MLSKLFPPSEEAQLKSRARPGICVDAKGKNAKRTVYLIVRNEASQNRFDRAAKLLQARLSHRRAALHAMLEAGDKAEDIGRPHQAVASRRLSTSLGGATMPMSSLLRAADETIPTLSPTTDKHLWPGTMKLLAYDEGSLTVEQRAHADEHLRTCTRCQKSLELLKERAELYAMMENMKD